MEVGAGAADESSCTARCELNSHVRRSNSRRGEVYSVPAPAVGAHPDGAEVGRRIATMSRRRRPEPVTSTIAAGELRGRDRQLDLAPRAGSAGGPRSASRCRPRCCRRRPRWRRCRRRAAPAAPIAAAARRARGMVPYGHGASFRRRRPGGSAVPRVDDEDMRWRGPWTPSTRWSSMSLVADGPLIQVSGRRGSSAASASGTSPTIWSARDDAHVVVGEQRQRPPALARARVEHDRPRLGDRDRAAGQHGVDRVQLARGTAAVRRAPRARRRACAPARRRARPRAPRRASRRIVAEDGAATAGQPSAAADRHRRRGSRRRARRTARRRRRPSASSARSYVARHLRRPAGRSASAVAQARRGSRRARALGHRAALPPPAAERRPRRGRQVAGAEPARRAAPGAAAARAARAARGGGRRPPPPAPRRRAGAGPRTRPRGRP